MGRAAGFTLIELMVTIAVLAIALTIAVPNFSNLIASNRAESQNTALVNAFSVARSEAVKLGTDVTVVPTDNSSWNNGWQVRQGTTILREFPALNKASLTRTTAGYTGVVSFNSRGQLAGATLGQAASFLFCVDGDHERLERRVSINAMGRVAISQEACP